MLGTLLLLGLIVLVVAVLGRANELQRELQRLKGRMDLLERTRAEGAEREPHEGAVASVAPPPEPSPAPLDPRAPEVRRTEAPYNVGAHAPARLEPSPSAPAATRGPAPRARIDAGAFEQLVGGVWLQNIGSVVLLLGVFLMIVWGYVTGRMSPPALVGSGLALGLAFLWRGDRIARTVPPFGHALIGVGFGIVYLTLDVGHFQLRAIPAPVAFVLLPMVSIATIATGLRYRVVSIAALGVIGAFVPQLLGPWMPHQRFDLSPAALLSYIAIVDCIVFLLAASAGWSGLNLTALVLSAASWVMSYGSAAWGWPVQIGLAALFTLLGLAPIPRLARRPVPARPLDLAVVAIAPLCFLAASAPVLMSASRGAVAMLLLALMIAHLATTLWVDSRRPERDLWRPVVAACVLYATLGFERLLGSDHTPLAWTVEGVTLVWLGARELRAVPARRPLAGERAPRSRALGVGRHHTAHGVARANGLVGSGVGLRSGRPRGRVARGRAAGCEAQRARRRTAVYGLDDVGLDRRGSRHSIRAIPPPLAGDADRRGVVVGFDHLSGVRRWMGAGSERRAPPDRRARAGDPRDRRRRRRAARGSS